MRIRKSLSDTIIVLLIFITLSSVAIVGILWILQANRRFEEVSTSIINEFYESRKTQIRNGVITTTDYIQYMRSQTEIRLKEGIRDRTYEAISIATNIYNQYKGTKSQREMMNMVKDSLRPIRFNEGRGYYFATTLDGIEQLFADRPELEGKNLTDMQDTRGFYVIREMMKIAKTEGEGFIKYQWTKPMVNGKDFPKIAFIKRFEPFNWYIGTGEYLDDVENDIKKEVLDRISNLRNGPNGYIFAFGYDGTVLSHYNKNYIGRSFFDVLDKREVEKFKKAMALAMRSEGCFHEYLAPIKPETGKPASKRSYLKAIPEWNWILGTGEYSDEIEKMVRNKKKALSTYIRSSILESAIFLVILILVIYFTFKRISLRVRLSFDVFTTFFNKASAESGKIDLANIDFAEFTTLAHAANHMIEERERIERDLRKSQEETAKLTMAIEQAAEFIVITDTSGVIQYVNPALETITGCSSKEFIGQHSRIFKSGKLPDIFYKELWETISNGKVWRGRFINRKKDGTFYEADSTISPLRDNDGRIINFVAVNHDVTRQVEMERQLQHAQKMEAIGTLAGGIAHDFNNMLGAIIGYSEMALCDLDPKSLPAENITQVLVASQRAKDIVKQILSFSRLGSDQKTPVRLEFIVKEAIKLIRASLPSTIEISQVFATEEDFIIGDPTRIQQVIINLCTNAYHAMENSETGGVLGIKIERLECPADSDGEVILECPHMEHGPYLKLSISDTGTGIEPAILDRIFEPYFTTKEQGKGTGFGLALVHSVIKNHSGYIKVRSEVGKGTTFEIYLPTIECISAVIANENESIHTSFNNESILFVDDEITLTNMGKQMLERLGYKVTAFNSSIAALEIFRTNPGDFDLVITDMTMPQMTGDKLAIEIKVIRPDIPVILCTGYSEYVSVQRETGADLNYFLMKPLTLRQMGNTVRSALNREPVLDE